MKSPRSIRVVVTPLSLVLSWLVLFVPGAAGQAMTLESLLGEMINRDALARYPQPAYRLREFSSYDRASETPAESAAWFANRDNGQFIRVEDNHGQREWVIMDHQAPGVIVRGWMPDQRAMPLGPSAVNTLLRIYLDGAETPAIEGHMLDLFNGTGLVPPPLAHKSLSSAVSFLPIAYAKSCKVTLDAAPFYYILTCREYPAGTPIRSFTMSELQAAGPVIERVGKALSAPSETGAGRSVNWKGVIAPGAEILVPLAAGPSAVRTLALKLADYDKEATRSLVLKIEFDGRPTVWCPVSEFFGTGIGLNPFQDWFRTVADDGTMTCRWVMPYQHKATVTLINGQKTPVAVSLSAVTGPWAWDDRSMYFHANWRRQFPLATRPLSDWNYLTLRGRGVYVGDTLTLVSPVSEWWGEGDGKVWVDGEKFPSMFGTGTEDYYGYSWGGLNNHFFEHPFHSQVRVGPNNRTHPIDEHYKNSTKGVNTLTRTRALDAMPCTTSLQVDMEIWHSQNCQVDYAVGTYWYGFADTTATRGPQPEDAAKAVPAAAMGRAGKNTK
jgi:hypothetical protein